jgi:molybdenum cofactor cytidylyltransferase
MNPASAIEGRYGIVILAAGSSTRLGQPKQLLIFEGSSLIKRVAEIALDVSGKVVVVTGYQSKKVQAELLGLPLIIVQNDSFEEGIASSIRKGLSTLIENFKGLKGVIFLVCDQPYLSQNVLTELIKSADETGKKIISSAYGDTTGIPVLFDKSFFGKLLALKGDIGAKKLIQENLADVATIHFPGGSIDIDTMQDFESVIGNR